MEYNAKLVSIRPAKDGNGYAALLEAENEAQSKWHRIAEGPVAQLMLSCAKGTPFIVREHDGGKTDFINVGPEPGTLPFVTASPEVKIAQAEAAAGQNTSAISAKPPAQSKPPAAQQRKGKVTVEEYMALEPPTKIGEWDYQRTVAALSRITPPEFLKEKSQGGQTMKFLSWHRVVEIANRYTPGWEYKILDTQVIPHPIKKDANCMALITKVEVTIHCADGSVTRQQQGIELFPVSGYGDASSNALSMAMRRAFAMHGLGIWLYSKAEAMEVCFDGPAMDAEE